MRIGVLGGGQLGRMLALAGRPLGFTFRFLEPKSPAPVDELGEVVRAGYDDAEALGRFVDGLDLVTYEFENVPVEALSFIERTLTVFPGPGALRMAEDRVSEKEGFRRLGVPTAPFVAVSSRASFDEALNEVELPAVLKTRRFGYDGKGQAVLRTAADVEPAWERLGGEPLILERFVDFSRELSSVAVRGRDGEVAFYPLVENEHRDGILYATTAPAPNVSDGMEETARTYVRAIMEELRYVGAMALELFQVDGGLLANEMAPRVHNSGHWTQDGALCCQFENHLRAIAGLPLGSPSPVLGHAAMVNLIGSTPPRERVLGVPGACLHLYGKEPRPGRKLGHVNVIGADPEGVASTVDRVEALLTP